MDVYLGYDVENTYIYGSKPLKSQCPQKTRNGIWEYPVSFTAHLPVTLYVTNRVH